MIDVNKNNLDSVLGDKSLAVLQFSAEWCGPCKMLTPIMASLSINNEQNDITFGKVNVDKSNDLGAKYNIRSIPTLIFFKDGVELERLSGLQGKSELQLKIDGLLN